MGSRVTVRSRISLAANTANDLASNQAPAAGPNTTFEVLLPATDNVPIFAVSDFGGTVHIMNADTGAEITNIRPLDEGSHSIHGPS